MYLTRYLNRKMPTDRDLEPLRHVVVLREVVNHWGKAENTVRLAIDDNRIVWRQAKNGIYLITFESVVKLWGEPKIPFEIW